MCIFCDLDDVSKGLDKDGKKVLTLEDRLKAERCRDLLNKRISCFLFVGFLGSGKTTLLNSLLEELSKKQIRVGVIENEAGPVSIDDKLLTTKASEEVIETPVIVTSGSCICCKVRGDLLKGLLSLADWRVDKDDVIGSASQGETGTKHKGLEYILLEASGLAEVRPIIQTFYDPSVQEKLNLKAVVAVLDCCNVEQIRQIDSCLENQVILADIVILNKSELVSSESIESTIKLVRSLNPLCTIKISKNASLSFENIEKPFAESFASVKKRLTVLEDSDGESNHTHVHYKWGSLALESHGVADLILLQNWLRTFVADEKRAYMMLGTNISKDEDRPVVYRGKGIIRYCEGLLQVQIVGTHISLTPVIDECILDSTDPSMLVLLAPALQDEDLRALLSTGFKDCFPGRFKRLYLMTFRFAKEICYGAMTKLAKVFVDLGRGRIDYFMKPKFS